MCPAGISKFVDVREFRGEFVSLKLGNGGSWCRFDGKLGKSYKLITVKQNSEVRYSWDVTDIEKACINKQVIYYMRENQIYNKKGRKIKLIKTYGKMDEEYKKPIGRRIRNYFKDQSCVACGSNSNLEIDHKNGLYNDPEVLDIKTQKIEHFQVLCKHCNDQKRQTIVFTKKYNKRYPASKIPMLKVFNIDFTDGDETFNPIDKDWAVGTYWYDPVKFMQDLLQQL